MTEDQVRSSASLELTKPGYSLEVSDEDNFLLEEMENDDEHLESD